MIPYRQKARKKALTNNRQYNMPGFDNITDITAISKGSSTAQNILTIDTEFQEIPHIKGRKEIVEILAV